jgi:dTDP-glucose 4,6-dehydratase
VDLICQRMGARLEDVAEIVGERVGKDAAYQLNSDKIRKDLGWTDKVSLEQGIGQTIDWVDANLAALQTLPQSYVHKA